MNAARIHLLFNHFPVVGLFIGICIFAYALIKKEHLFEQAAKIIFIVSALICVGVFFSGEGAEEIIEELDPNINHELIHEHEEAGEAAFYLMIALGVLSMLSLLGRNRGANFKKRLTWVIAILAIVSAFFLANASHHGAEIQHLQEMYHH